MSEPLPSPMLTVYRRAGCDLCDELDDAIALVLDERRAAGVVVPRTAVVDVDGDAGMAARYGALVPVLTLGDAELPLAMGARHVRRFLARTLDGGG